MKKNSKQKWLDDKSWGCMIHIPMAKIPANGERCWFCKAERPPAPGKLDLVFTGAIPPSTQTPSRAPLPKKAKSGFSFTETPGEVRAKCAWRNCLKSAATNSKYCSRNCSNKNARDRAKSRTSDSP